VLPQHVTKITLLMLPEYFVTKLRRGGINLPIQIGPQRITLSYSLTLCFNGLMPKWMFIKNNRKTLSLGLIASILHDKLFEIFSAKYLLLPFLE
jgi:hypothetical protein